MKSELQGKKLDVQMNNYLNWTQKTLSFRLNKYQAAIVSTAPPSKVEINGSLPNFFITISILKRFFSLTCVIS